MNIAEPFIRKPVATTLLVVAITLAGAAPPPLPPFPDFEVEAFDPEVPNTLGQRK